MSKSEKKASGNDLAISKRSITVDGERKSSISLEGPFWRQLRAIATSGNRSVSSLVAHIREQYPDQNLSSACRLYVLQDALGRLP